MDSLKNSDPHNLRHSTVLVVDDEVSVRDLYHLILTRAGYNVLMAADGQSALTILEKETPKVSLIDGNLPDMEGIKLGRIINQSWPAITSYLVTGDTVNLDKEAAQQAGFEAIISKPVSVSTLLQAVSTTIPSQVNR